MSKTKNNTQKENLIYDLVDLSLIPAFLLIIAKVGGITFLNWILNLDWRIVQDNSLFINFKLTYPTLEQVVMVNSYSNLFMYICILAGVMVITSKSMLLNHRKASPYLVLKLAKMDLLYLLQASIKIYKEAFVWLLFLVITTVYIFISFLMELNYAWIVGLVIVTTLLILWIVIQNIEEDILYTKYK